MEPQMDAFSQKRFELMVEMATKKLNQEIASLKEAMITLHNELGSLKSQVHRVQFTPPQQKTVHIQHQDVGEQPKEEYKENTQDATAPVKKEVKIIDCRADDEKKSDFVSGAAKNSEPVRPRYGDYNSQDVSIDKFFYFGRK